MESGKGKRKQSEAVECAIEMEEVLLRFVAYGAVSGLIREEDYVYIYNSLAGLLQYEPKEYREEAVQEKGNYGYRGGVRRSVREASFRNSGFCSA